jgi:hypothetical protein
MISDQLGADGRRGADAEPFLREVLGPSTSPTASLDDGGDERAVDADLTDLPGIQHAAP